MRRANQFSTSEWLALLPLREAVRQWRNDVLLWFYKRARSPALPGFLERTREFAGRDVAIVIAFKQPWTLDWLLAEARRHLASTQLLVFDNSPGDADRDEIREVCLQHGVPYLALPRYRTRHVNRSHGMAMSWVFHNVVRPLKPRVFGFLDHDMIPVRPVDVQARLDGQRVFGLRNAGNFGHWSIWAGYCFFRYEATSARPLNFLYDFSRGLDTGGRNWDALYRHLDARRLRFATQDFVSIRLPGTALARQVEVIDQRWVHMGGVGYNENFSNKFEFFAALKRQLDEGTAWDQLVTGKKTPHPVPAAQATATPEMSGAR